MTENKNATALEKDQQAFMHEATTDITIDGLVQPKSFNKIIYYGNRFY